MRVDSSPPVTALPFDEASTPTVAAEQPGQTIQLPAGNAEPPSAPSVADRQFEQDAYSLLVKTKVAGNLGPSGASGTLAAKQTGTSHTAATRKASGSQFEGMMLGANRLNQPVQVKRELGSTKGYDARLQAVAVARMFGAEPAVVVLDGAGKWHALETTHAFQAGRVNNTDPAPPPGEESAAAGTHMALSVWGLPSAAGIPAARQKVDALQQKVDDLVARRNNGENTKAVQDQLSDAASELRRANLALQSLVLGVPESELNPIRSPMYREAGKINIDADTSVNGGLTGGAGNHPLEFDVDKPPAFEINRRMFQSDAAPGTMFHEVTHVSDYELAQQWVRTYQNETHRLFVGGVGPAPGKTQTPFDEWLTAQVPKRLSQADAELVRNEVNGNYSTSEARANIRTFLLGLQSGAPESRTTAQLTSYVRELKPGGTYGNPNPGSSVTAELVQELKTAYRAMSPSMQHQFQAALAAAKRENPNAWVSNINLGF